jgi:hypothetical protein
MVQRGLRSVAFLGNPMPTSPIALRHSSIPVKSPLGSADVAQLVEQLIRNQ